MAEERILCVLHHIIPPSSTTSSSTSSSLVVVSPTSGRSGRDVEAYRAALIACRQELRTFIDEQNSMPILIRLAWHDSGTFDRNSTAEWPNCGGANGSIRFEGELAHGANAGLAKAIRWTAAFQRKHAILSHADVIQLASAVSIELAGGPKIPMRYGRVDADAPAPDGRLPAALHGTSADAAAHLREVFGGRMGFSDQEIVALSGAHTVGRAFHERSGVVQERAGEASATVFTKSDAIVRCDGRSGVGMPGGRSWTTKWLTFDNSYFARIVNDAKTNASLLWLPTDQALYDDVEFRRYFEIYARDNDRFLQDYAKAHSKLSELGSKFDPPQGIYID